MDESGTTTPHLTFEQLANLRDKTETVAQFLKDRLKNHLETLRPAFAPRRVLGKYTGTRDGVAGEDKAFAQLQTQYQEVCRNPFALPPELEQDSLANIDNQIDVYPWEYTYEAKGAKEAKILTMNSPARWILTYSSGYTLAQVRQAVSGLQDRRSDYVRQFVVNALVMRFMFDRYPGIPQLLTDLRYEVRIEKCQGLGELPFVTISACLPSFRPADELILTATRFSGIPAFIELINVDTVPTLQDPLKLYIERLLRS
jgi:hypothetical protein